VDPAAAELVGEVGDRAVAREVRIGDDNRTADPDPPGSRGHRVPRPVGDRDRWRQAELNRPHLVRCGGTGSGAVETHEVATSVAWLSATRLGRTSHACCQVTTCTEIAN
jgi:hypothetical protein